MRSLTMLFFAAATYMLGTAAGWIYVAGNLGGSEVVPSALVKLVTIIGPVVFLAAAAAFFRKDRGA